MEHSRNGVIASTVHPQRGKGDPIEAVNQKNNGGPLQYAAYVIGGSGREVVFDKDTNGIDKG